MDEQELTTTVQAMMQVGKGLLAMDESTPTCNKRFAKLGIPQTEEARRAWRELILDTPGLGEFISGANYRRRDHTSDQKRRHALYQTLDRGGDCSGH